MATTRAGHMLQGNCGSYLISQWVMFFYYFFLHITLPICLCSSVVKRATMQTRYIMFSFLPMICVFVYVLHLITSFLTSLTVYKIQSRSAESVTSLWYSLLIIFTVVNWRQPVEASLKCSSTVATRIQVASLDLCYSENCQISNKCQCKVSYSNNSSFDKGRMCI